MKIKQPKYMTEKEALYWLADNLKTDGGLEREGVFYKVEFIDEDNKLCWTTDGRYYIDEEVEITESTILEEMVIVRTIEYKNGDVQKIITLATHKSINDVKGEEDWNKKSILHEVWTVKGNGMGELIWTKERGLID
ncbi:hypothetical protein QNJ24_07940 [Macrococcus caseolyticus]|uniref:hypothetical protein n=2 Tax=Macrococcoides caseolyticum TaxID=69966 RepID=UPI0024BCFE70|nr:hypothetical protein [Macrococcus caseolyticus]MDJ1156040.1 hypothetical protein [Macrococcus caseolyticus]